MTSVSNKVFISIEQEACNLVVIDLSSTSATHFPPNYRKMPSVYCWDTQLDKIITLLPGRVQAQLGCCITDVNEYQNNDTHAAVFGNERGGIDLY
jgi:hypothetical protein